MVWAGISYSGRTDLIQVQGNLTARRYLDEIIRPHVLPFMNRQNVIFQHDNARPHTARIPRDFLAQNNVQVLDWPSRSPNLNPIEHLGDELDRRVRQRDPQPQTLPALFVALRAEYQLIRRHFIRNLVQSMGHRCQATIDANGGHTRY